MKNYTKIPNEVFSPSQLSARARFLFCVLLKYCGKDDHCFPSQNTLGQDLGYTGKHIRTLLKELIDAGLVSKKRRGWNRSNTYHVVKSLGIKRTPASLSDRKRSSTPSGKSNSPHLRSPVPIHRSTPVPPKSTYLKGKGKRSLKGLEKCRKELVKKGILPNTKLVIKPKAGNHGN